MLASCSPEQRRLPLEEQRRRGLACEYYAGEAGYPRETALALRNPDSYANFAWALQPRTGGQSAGGRTASSSGLSGGAIAGIVIGSIAGAAATAGIIYGIVKATEKKE
jgi:hypothetical protein